MSDSLTHADEPSQADEQSQADELSQVVADGLAESDAEGLAESGAEGLAESETHAAESHAGAEVLGLRHFPLVVTSPGKVFSLVEDNGAYGWALTVLLTLVSLIGYVQVQSGLIDQSLDQQTEKKLAQVEAEQGTLVDRIRLKETMEDVRQQGVFLKLISKLFAYVLSPVSLLVSFLLISAFLYAVVALTGRKPEFHTLMSICVYAGFVELIAHLLGVSMMFYYRSLDVGTTLKGLGAAGEATVWAAVDPFQMWFWVLVGIGLTVTRQLSRRMAIVSTVLLCHVGIGLRVGVEFGAGGI